MFLYLGMIQLYFNLNLAEIKSENKFYNLKKTIVDFK